MTRGILKFCIERGILLDKDSLNLLDEFDENTARNIIEKISCLKEKIITKSFFSDNVEKIQEMIEDKGVIDKLRINLGLSLEISRQRFVKKHEIEEGSEEESEEEEKRAEREFRVEHLKITNSLANLTKKLEVGDFVRYFKSRYSEMKILLQERKELEGLVSINKLSEQRQSLSIVAMVYAKRVTKPKNILFEVEDLTGRATVLVTRNKGDIYEKAKEVLVDDIIGIKGFGDREIIFANNIIYPDAFLDEKSRLDRDERAAFISDIHIGSTNFLEKNFLHFINWLNGGVGNERQREEAKKVKYLLITGDCVDGVGIFPGQEELLVIKDVRQQYEKLAEYLDKIRKDIRIIICPGQHDAVRVAEPQPAITKEYASPLYDLKNVVLVSNPTMVEIINNGKRGIKILMYHGASMSHYVNEIESLRLGKAHDNPSKVVREMLKRRHLASMHSAVTYIPTEKYDSLMIREVPDIINTADFHKPDVDTYNNILIICSSCWQ
ncbi:MAG: metallophosphoesterase, partial [Nanoarchaeota archaeon]